MPRGKSALRSEFTMVSVRSNDSRPHSRRATGLALLAGLAVSSLGVLAWASGDSVTEDAAKAPAAQPITVQVGDTTLTVPGTDGSTRLVLPDGRVLTLTVAPAQASLPTVFEVVFVLDTTGSMSGLIEGAKQKIWAIASHIQQAENKPEVRMGMVAYRDRGDVYVIKVTPLTSDIDAVHADLMQFQANGGGDTPESVNEALNRAFGEMQWSPDEHVVRLVYLVGDAPPKEYPNDVAYMTSVPQAKQSGITVHAIQCGNIGGTEEHWRQIAQLGGGSYARVEQSGGAVIIQTPYDKELSELNHKLTETIIPYGRIEDQRFAMSQMRVAVELDRDASMNSNADRAEFRALNTDRMLGRADLTTQIVSGIVTIEGVNTELLPENLQKLDAAEQIAYITVRIEKRVDVQKRIAEIAAKRAEWIRENGAALGQNDGFDDFIAKSIQDALRDRVEQSDDKAETKPQEPKAISER